MFADLKNSQKRQDEMRQKPNEYERRMRYYVYEV